MNFLDQHRDERALAAKIGSCIRARRVIMEVCSNSTHSVLRPEFQELLPSEIELVAGPPCPVCAAPPALIEKAQAIAAQPGVILAAPCDMLRVPGSHSDLFQVKAAGGDVRVATSPMDALRIARKNPLKKVVYFGIGFETAAAASAMALHQAAEQGLKNFWTLTSYMEIAPAVQAVLDSRSNPVQGLIVPGHVCTVAGYRGYQAFAAGYQLPVVLSGFEPLDVLEAILLLVKQIEDGRPLTRPLPNDDTVPARKLLESVFDVAHGYSLQPKYAEFDAEKVFEGPAKKCSGSCSGCCKKATLPGTF